MQIFPQEIHLLLSIARDKRSLQFLENLSMFSFQLRVTSDLVLWISVLTWRIFSSRSSLLGISLASQAPNSLIDSTTSSLEPGSPTQRGINSRLYIFTVVPNASYAFCAEKLRVRLFDIVAEKIAM